MEIHVKHFFDFHILSFFWFSITILSYPFILPTSQLQTQQPMTSQNILCVVTHRIFNTNFILLLMLYSKLMRIVAAPAVMMMMMMMIITLQRGRCFGYLYPHNPRGRNVAVPAFVLVFILVFSPRDLYYRGQIIKKYIIIIIIIRNLYSAIMPLGGYRGAGGTGR